MKKTVIIKEFRSDGWPLCPICEDDELWTAEMPARIGSEIAGCYLCGTGIRFEYPLGQPIGGFLPPRGDDVQLEPAEGGVDSIGVSVRVIPGGAP